MARRSSIREAARHLGFRSGLEATVARFLEAQEVPAEYEKNKLKYEVPARVATYTPDWLLPNGIVIETKGLFNTADRQKHLLIKNQHPDLELRFVFSRVKTRISKISKTTYGDWAKHHGFQFAEEKPPIAWLNEPPNPHRMAAARAAFGIKS